MDIFFFAGIFTGENTGFKIKLPVSVELLMTKKKFPKNFFFQKLANFFVTMTLILKYQI